MNIEYRRVTSDFKSMSTPLVKGDVVHTNPNKCEDTFYSLDGKRCFHKGSYNCDVRTRAMTSSEIAEYIDSLRILKVEEQRMSKILDSIGRNDEAFLNFYKEVASNCSSINLLLGE